MKIKRNKRVEQNLKIRLARIQGKDDVSALSWQKLRLTIGVLNRRPKSLMSLLEQDVETQTARMQRLGHAITESMEQAELSLVPVLEPVSDVPIIEPVEEPPVTEDAVESVPEADGGRTNYQYVRASERVRRRIIS